MKRLLIVRLGSLGDLVHTLPAVSAIRRTYPELDVDWLVDAVHREFLSLVPVISSIVVVEDRTAGAWFRARRQLQSRHYDVAADFQGLVKSAALARLSGARRLVGFGRDALREPAAAFLYTERVPVAAHGQHVIAKNLDLAKALGASVSGPLEFPIANVESAALESLRASGTSTFALLNPGAAWPNKRWPPADFARVARHLRDRHQLASIVIWGPGEDDLAKAVVDASGGAATAAPPTTLTDLVALARAARLFVSGDTGPTHIAAAVGTPVVALFGPTDPARNGPWASADRILARYDACDCHYERRCSRAAGWCLGTVHGRRRVRSDRRAAGERDMNWSSLARLRVPLGFLCAAISFALARPTSQTLLIGLAVAVPGEVLRLWASGHIDKGREITTSGPYRFMRHPLYLGSAILGAGFIIAAWNVIVAVLVGAYLAVTIVAAIRTEEATLDARFSGAYADYRAGRTVPAQQRFSWARVAKNREYRAVIGFVLGFGLLALRGYF